MDSRIGVTRGSRRFGARGAPPRLPGPARPRAEPKVHRALGEARGDHEEPRTPSGAFVERARRRPLAPVRTTHGEHAPEPVTRPRAWPAPDRRVPLDVEAGVGDNQTVDLLDLLGPRPGPAHGRPPGPTRAGPASPLTTTPPHAGTAAHTNAACRPSLPGSRAIQDPSRAMAVPREAPGPRGRRLTAAIAFPAASCASEAPGTKKGRVAERPAPP